jgi:O-antigen ligase
LDLAQGKTVVSQLDLVPAENSTIGSGADADTLIRSALFLAAFLSAWISFHPFQSLAEPPQTFAEGGDFANQIGFTALFIVLAAWTYVHEPRRLFLLIRPALILLLLWIAVTVVTSWEPLLAARRFAFAVVLMAISGMVLLLPKNARHFRDLMALTALIVLAVCYLGVILAPEFAIHQPTDFVEPEHAGSWRGLFPHKNQAGATMVLFIFIGMFAMRARRPILGGLIVTLASIFLLFSQSKTAIAVLPLVLLLSTAINHVRKPAVGILLVVLVLAAFNLFSVGTVIFEPIRRLVGSVMPDATFTGRTEIWELALQYVATRPITGYGFLAFWGTDHVINGLGDSSNWVNIATDAHNAYLNLALAVGIPGLALIIAWVVVLPVADYYRLSRRRAAPGQPLQLLFLRVCLYGVYTSCFESAIFQPVGEVWFLFLTSIFGLRYLTRTSVKE